MEILTSTETIVSCVKQCSDNSAFSAMTKYSKRYFTLYITLHYILQEIFLFMLNTDLTNVLYTVRRV